MGNFRGSHRAERAAEKGSKKHTWDNSMISIVDHALAKWGHGEKVATFHHDVGGDCSGRGTL